MRGACDACHCFPPSAPLIIPGKSLVGTRQNEPVIVMDTFRRGLSVGLATFTALAIVSGAVAGTAGGQVYRWVDEKGVVHFGDSLPPEAAEKDRQVLNSMGVAVRDEQVSTTPGERAESARAEAQRAARAADEARDRVLLSTYLSVEEIESLRDQRAGLIEGQIELTQNYLHSLRDKLLGLQDEASRYKPYSTDPAAPPIEEKLSQEISDTVDLITLYEKTLTETRSRRTELVAAFDADIARFRELKTP